MNLDDLRWTRVDIPGVRNLRDLGGYPTHDGRTIRRGVFYRSEVLTMPGTGDAYARYDAGQQGRYRALGVRTVVDLRTSAERGKYPSVWRQATGADVVELPVLECDAGYDSHLLHVLFTGKLPKLGLEETIQFYWETIETHAEVFGEVIRLLGRANRSAVLVHCTGGKDRTGIATAFVLDVLGVPRDVVIRDYHLTETLLPDERKRYEPVLRAAGLDPDEMLGMFEAPKAVMRATLQRMDDTYGGVAAFLRERGGLAETDLKALRENLLEGP
ncbi:tyrosine-protein phosphatase [Thermocrispum sp.]|uniref:tyrosine-protein phosphatase n=1 Tax=Thermocrispum sp. TaxID=2060768 RepID=UPI00257C8070|nr:tyrosine-protein phosphatase [Thermocrispum sp.]